MKKCNWFILLIICLIPLTGCEKDLDPNACARCMGKGTIPVLCSNCHSTGQTYRACTACTGRGWRLVNNKQEICQVCLGTGQTLSICPTCHGNRTTCPQCNGTGKKSQKETK